MKATLALLCLLAAPSFGALASRRHSYAPATGVILGSKAALRAASSPQPSVGSKHRPAGQLLALRGGGVPTPPPKSALGSLVDMHLGAKAMLALACLSSALVLAFVLRAMAIFWMPTSLSESGKRSVRWNQLKDDHRAACDYIAFAGTEGAADGAAAEHASAARHEAARKLVYNHEAVLRDITRRGGPPVSQPELARVDADEAVVDAALYEVARRLIGRVPGQRVRAAKPSGEAQAATWAATAAYLSARLQGTSDDMSGVHKFERRAADMSDAAAAAMRAVLAEVGAEAPAVGYFARATAAMAAPAPRATA